MVGPICKSASFTSSFAFIDKYILQTRDIWFSVVGFENARRIPEDETKIALFTLEDWSPELPIAPHHRDILPEITPLHKQFFTEVCQLGLLGMRIFPAFTVRAEPQVPADERLAAKFLKLLGPSRPVPTLVEAHSFLDSVIRWRVSFPEDLLLDRICHWDENNSWVLFLWSMGYRLECSFYRTFRQRTMGVHGESAAWANERLRRCIFELDTVLKRAIVHDVARYCPPSLYDIS